MNIAGVELAEEHEGREVVYVPRHLKTINHPGFERGFITSWNDRFVFVRYKPGVTSVATCPEDLRWA